MYIECNIVTNKFGSSQEVTVVETVEPMGRMKRSRPDSAEPKSDDDEEDGDDDSDAFGMSISRT